MKEKVLNALQETRERGGTIDPVVDLRWKLEFEPPMGVDPRKSPELLRKMPKTFQRDVMDLWVGRVMGEGRVVMARYTVYYVV